MALDDSGRNYREVPNDTSEVFRTQNAVSETRIMASFIVKKGLPDLYRAFLRRHGLQGVKIDDLGKGFYRISAMATRNELFKALNTQKGLVILKDENEDGNGDASEEATQQVA